MRHSRKIATAAQQSNERTPARKRSTKHVRLDHRCPFAMGATVASLSMGYEIESTDGYFEPIGLHPIGLAFVEYARLFTQWLIENPAAARGRMVDHAAGQADDDQCSAAHVAADTVNANRDAILSIARLYGGATHVGRLPFEPTLESAGGKLSLGFRMRMLPLEYA